MPSFKLQRYFDPTGDQPQAIDKLTRGLQKGASDLVLLGVTGSGKTYTIANVIERVKRPVLVISHNKTLAAQLYQEFRDFFPHNAVSYFVSYYDYYQPEAYIPATDTYIEKETNINSEIDKLRLAATTNLLTRPDTIVVASVSCIYNLGSPVEYGKSILELVTGLKVERSQIMKRLGELMYERSDISFQRGTFRVRGEVIDVYPAYSDSAIRIELEGNFIVSLKHINPISGREVAGGEKSYKDSFKPAPPGSFRSIVVYPAKHYVGGLNSKVEVFNQIRIDLEKRVKELREVGRELEAHRLNQKVNYDLEMVEELGYVNGIENYSRYFDGRDPGDPPFTLLDYFPEDYLVVIDESHISVPQIRGMYNGDRSRKQTLIDYGFRLPSALDNRPLKFDEFLRRVRRVVYTSATPNEWEISRALESGGGGVVEQLIRPTGLIDPKVSVRPVGGQVEDLLKEIFIRKKRGERVLVTTLTKRLAEDLSDYLAESEDIGGGKIKVNFLHSDIKTLDRVEILSALRKGEYDVIVGINLLREGLDLPEVSLVAILDADKEGFLRSRTSLIQTMGRAARHLNGEVIMYADETTGSMREAIAEVGRRRETQLKYNVRNNIEPKSISKPIRERLVEREDVYSREFNYGTNPVFSLLSEFDPADMTPDDRGLLVRRLEKEMREQAKLLQFETAAKIRDKVKELKLM